MNVSVIAIGDELLIGQVIDTNSGFIARTIAPAGWTLREVMLVHDDATAIKSAIDRAMSHSEVVITTGGLGPTKDDITKTVLCEYFGGTLRTDPIVLENVKSLMARRGLALNDLTAAQAAVPTSCRVINNRVGTAPVMWFERNGHTLVSLPGVPSEMCEMFGHEVFAQLLEAYGASETIAHRVILVAGITESAAAERLTQIENNLPDYLHLAYLPDGGLLRLRLDGHHRRAEFIESELDRYENAIIGVLGNKVLWRGDMSLPEIALSLMRREHLTLSTAESCTGGNVAHSITLVPGSSDVFNGSVVSYSNEMKINILGVSADTIARDGAVSESVVAAMAEGARRVTASDYAVATSGIAGPSGGTPEKPVGTVCIAVSGPDGTQTATHRFNGTRSTVIDRATKMALITLIRRLNG